MEIIVYRGKFQLGCGLNVICDRHFIAYTSICLENLTKWKSACKPFINVMPTLTKIVTFLQILQDFAAPHIQSFNYFIDEGLSLAVKVIFFMSNI